MTYEHNTKRLAKEIKALRKKSQKHGRGLSSHEESRLRQVKGRLVKLALTTFEDEQVSSS